ncbi:MAG: bifunctional diaminohydroxyphosphoribosylaminopyrimidine deaminase/5-amino-6-(5-phosphoribosylamino)uracil reductase, partial [Chitinispirillia bacterium]|nr:bifunctional diaminohydroxyphosphoribosylaminopyrimidine deaminase/5-amino-6-(5-phosphoribosylamino)uracil reductase [Chitinispirillia bacterium]MCL2269646.1 bifunctional diaminohydroxyphosphoribosylaminopyrimidine deaminase/5-amino-6-(5-phosphoribosylamino)uracil reductase [Chitinispirillia bacterium]
MRRALSLAQKAKGTTFPNPAVGAVVVDAGGGVIGEGATDVYGGP